MEYWPDYYLIIYEICFINNPQSHDLLCSPAKEFDLGVVKRYCCAEAERQVSY